MWLINVKTRKLEPFFDENQVKYAILSHTWDVDEVTFQDMLDGKGKDKKGYQKINYTCRQALEDGLPYAWVDTCSIDKSSSAELSESINAMYSYYRKAKICYAFLADAKLSDPLSSEQGSGAGHFVSMDGHRFCRWFRRGWTLQELIAPLEIKFYGPDWEFLGYKTGLLDELSASTGIDQKALKGLDIHSFSIAQRMSWAAGRETTRIEDRAYSLLGIFNINMPLLYGEGENAFVRLQEAIIRRSADHSIFAHNSQWSSGLLSSSPAWFKGSSIVPLTSSTPNITEILESHQLNQFGLKIYAVCAKRDTLRLGNMLDEQYFIALKCRCQGDYTGYVGLEVIKHETETANVWRSSSSDSRLTIIPSTVVEQAKPEWHLILRKSVVRELWTPCPRPPVPHVWLRTDVFHCHEGNRNLVMPAKCWLGQNEFVPDIRSGKPESSGFRIIQEIFSDRQRIDLAIAFRIFYRYRSREQFMFYMAFCALTTRDPQLQMESAQACLVNLDGNEMECSWTSQQGDVFIAKAKRETRLKQDLIIIDITKQQQAAVVKGTNLKFPDTRAESFEQLPYMDEVTMAKYGGLQSWHVGNAVVVIDEL